MLRYRTFLNIDPPALAEIWRSQPPLRGVMQGITSAMLEELVLSKPYFDQAGLIVAVDGARPVGFVHAGFGGTADETGIDPSRGSTCLLMVSPHERRAEIGCELLAASEHYLRKHGAKTLLGGGLPPANPYYLGLYGGCQTPGILASDEFGVSLFEQQGYREAGRTLLLSRSLLDFRPPIDRQQRAIKMRCHVAAVQGILPETWWGSRVWINSDWTRFELQPRSGGSEPLCSVTFWDVQPLARSWGLSTTGLVKITDTPVARAEGLTLFLLAEALLLMFQEQGVALAEAQVADADLSTQEMFSKLGFTAYDQGIQFHKSA